MAQFLHSKEERKAWYMARKLFQDEPVLSPIPELREPINRSDSTESLPELNVEVVSKRKDVDETEEFYQKLEKAMMEIIYSDRVYNIDPKDVIDEESIELINSDSSETYVIQYLDKSDELNVEKSSAHIGCADEELSPQSKHNKSETHKSRHLSIYYANDNKQTPCERHRMSASDSLVRSKESSNDSHKLAGTEDASEIDYDDHSLSRPETMRKQRAYALRTTDIYKYISEHSRTRQSMDSYPESLSFIASEMSMHSNNASQISIEPLMCSTPKSYQLEKRRKRKHKLSEYSSQKKSKAAQTSLSNNDENVNNDFSNFFVGKPIFYNLCTCKDHVCA